MISQVPLQSQEKQPGAKLKTEACAGCPPPQQLWLGTVPCSVDRCAGGDAEGRSELSLSQSVDVSGAQRGSKAGRQVRGTVWRLLRAGVTASSRSGLPSLLFSTYRQGLDELFACYSLQDATFYEHAIACCIIGGSPHRPQGACNASRLQGGKTGPFTTISLATS